MIIIIANSVKFHTTNNLSSDFNKNPSCQVNDTNIFKFGILFELIEKGNYELIWSFILEYENSRNPFIERRLHIQSISTLCKEGINLVMKLN